PARVMQADGDVGGVHVGELAPSLDVGALLDRSGQQRAGADPAERGGGGFSDAVDDVGLGNARPSEQSGVGAPVSGVEEHAAALESAAEVARDALAQCGFGTGSDAAAKTVERCEGFVSRVSVRGKTNVVLKL